jgi:hypothetical protein
LFAEGYQMAASSMTLKENPEKKKHEINIAILNELI